MKIAIIPARGGSKRIPKKNVRQFCGSPIISWSISTALRSDLFARVIVSTDDKEIAAIAKAYGAEVPFMRPSRLADDYIGTIPTIQHAIHAVEQENFFPHFVCCIYPAAPFVSVKQLRDAFSILQKEDIDFVFPAAPYSPPVQRGFVVTDEGNVQMWSPNDFSRRSQDLTNVFHDTGQFYWAKNETWKESKIIFSPKSRILRVGVYEAIDIDSLDDWEFAEHIFSQRTKA